MISPRKKELCHLVQNSEKNNLVMPEKQDKKKLIQECMGEECPFLENHKVCMYKVYLTEKSLCTIEHQKPVHTYEEIAKILGISKQSVMYLEKQALEKMKEKMLSQLNEEGLTENDLFE